MTVTYYHLEPVDLQQKLAISGHRLRVAQSRKGRRPMRVSTLLRKEKEGTLYKHAGARSMEPPLNQIWLGSFTDEIAQIAKEAGLVDVARRGVSRGASAVAGAAERAGARTGSGVWQGAGTAVRALNAPIETGALGHIVQDSGQRLLDNSKNTFGQGVGRALHHEGHQLARGGTQAVMGAGFKLFNPLGTAAEVGAAGLGNVAAKAMKAPEGGRLDRVLTHHIPKALEYGVPASAAMATGIPMGLAGVVGHQAMGGMAAAAPVLGHLGEAAHHGVLESLGHGAAEFAHHGATDVAGTHAQNVIGGAVNRSPAMLQRGGAAISRRRQAVQQQLV